MGLIIETHNITSGGGFAEILAASKAHLLMLQETHADKKKDKELRSLAGKLGWKRISTPAIPQKEGNTEAR